MKKLHTSYTSLKLALYAYNGVGSVSGIKYTLTSSQHLNYKNTLTSRL